MAHLKNIKPIEKDNPDRRFLVLKRNRLACPSGIFNFLVFMSNYD